MTLKAVAMSGYNTIVQSSQLQSNAALEILGVNKEITVYFVIKKSKPGAYWWAIKSDGNHEPLAHSEILSSKQACLNAINIVYREAGQAPYRDETGEG